MSPKIENELLEERLEASAAGYEQLVLLTRELNATLSHSGTADLARTTERIFRLTEQIHSADKGLGEMLMKKHETYRRHPLVLRILDLLDELQGLTTACIPRLEAVRAVSREEIASSRKARSALSGYRTGGPARGGNLSETF